MAKIKVVTDNSCDLPSEWIKENNVEIIKLKTFIDGQERDITADEIVDEFKKGKKVTSSQPTSSEFEKLYSKILDEYDAIISVHLSSKLSGTYNSASLAAKQFPGKIEIIDSLTTTSALGAMVGKAVELSKTGDLNKSAEELRKLSLTVKTIFGVQTVENLIRGGRAHLIAGKLVTLLNVKPVLKGEDGEIKFYKIVLGFQRVLREIVKYVESYDVIDKKVYIAHVNAHESVNYIISKLGADYTFIVGPTSPIIALNAGEGAVLIGFLVNQA